MVSAAAETDHIVTFGVRPTRAATEYGYIRPGAAIEPEASQLSSLLNWILEAAKHYVADGYLWNSGNFLFRAGFLLEEYDRFEPESAAAINGAVEAAGNDLGSIPLDPEMFARATAKSIDYAVMERTARAAVAPVSFGWSDVGSWQAVWELSSHDEAGNAAKGSAVFVDARDTYVASDKQLVSRSAGWTILSSWRPMTQC